MADEYIRRDDAIKIAERYGLSNGSVLGRHTGLADCIASEISCLPAANVAPVVHGRWEIVVGSNGNEYMVCSCCRVSQNLTGVFTYCPNCGCRMDGGDNSEVD